MDSIKANSLIKFNTNVNAQSLSQLRQNHLDPTNDDSTETGLDNFERSD
jgi:hypothetical protein